MTLGSGQTILDVDFGYVGAGATTTTTSSTDPVVVVFDPAISKVGVLQDGGIGLPGETLTWMFTITNVGNGVGSNIVISDVIRPELRIENAQIDRGSVTISGQTVTFNIDWLDPGESINAQVVTTVLRSPVGGVFDNTVNLTGFGPTGITRTASASAEVPIVLRLPATGYPPRDN